MGEEEAAVCWEPPPPFSPFARVTAEQVSLGAELDPCRSADDVASLLTAMAKYPEGTHKRARRISADLGSDEWRVERLLRRHSASERSSRGPRRFGVVLPTRPCKPSRSPCALMYGRPRLQMSLAHLRPRLSRRALRRHSASERNSLGPRRCGVVLPTTCKPNRSPGAMPVSRTLGRNSAARARRTVAELRKLDATVSQSSGACVLPRRVHAGLWIQYCYEQSDPH